MKRKYFTYILLVVVSLFVFDNRVEAEVFSGTNVGRYKSCEEMGLNNNWLLEPTSAGKDYTSCIYTKTINDYFDSTKKSCIIFQLSFPKTDKNKMIKKGDVVTKINVNSWGEKEGNRTQTYDSSYAGEWYPKDGNSNGCPKQLFFTHAVNSAPVGDKYTIKVAISKLIGAEKLDYKYGYYNDGSNSNNAKIISANKNSNKTCEDILGDYLIGILQSLVNIVKVAVPIMLIVFGILDFSKAIFSSEEGEMKKVQTKFIKRVIIAIGFFLIPTFLGLLLDIANNIWGNIDTTLCGIEL